MSNLLSFFIPKERKFFTMFEQATGNLVEISKLLVEMVKATSTEERKKLRNEIENLEHVGDNITHDILNQLSLSFITPFDREDIHLLAVVIDDIADYINGVASRIIIYKIEPSDITPEVIKLAELILKCCEELQIAVEQLKDLKHVEKINEAYVRINSIENHADDIFDMAIGQLFEEEKDPIKLIKMKELYATLETATDKAEDAADIIKSIQVKHA
jgi:predicted phosphate transport protein (TIGR00153 family)